VRVSLGQRSANLRALAERRTIDLERSVQRLDSRRLAAFAGFTSRRIQKTTHGWAVGTWIKLVGGVWSAAATSSSFTADQVVLVYRVVDADTVDVVTDGYIQIPTLSFTAWAPLWLSTVDGVATTTKPVAPNVDIPLGTGHEDGWIEVKVLPATITTPVSVANGGTGKTGITSGTFWYASATDVLSEATITGFGRGLVACADAAAGRTQLGLGSLAVLSSLALSALSDVTITSVADLDLLRYDSGTSKWKNVNLGPMIWVSASREFALDGGAAASAASVVGVGKAASRLLVNDGSGLDFKLSGSVASGTEKCARIRSTAASDVSFYDQATSTFSAGDLVMQWGTTSTVANRYFRFYLPVQQRDNSGAGSVDLILKSGATQLWDVADNVSGTTKYLSFVGPSGDAASVRRILLAQPLDLAGKTIYADKGGGSSDNLVFSSSGLTLTSGGAATITLTGASTLDFSSGTFTFTRSGGTAVLVIGSTTKVGSSAGSLGFYQGAGTTKQTVSGAKAGNVALANLMTALANLGLVTDSTT
jgi:hypothetical protein